MRGPEAGGLSGCLSGWNFLLWTHLGSATTRWEGGVKLGWEFGCCGQLSWGPSLRDHLLGLPPAQHCVARFLPEGFSCCKAHDLILGHSGEQLQGVHTCPLTSCCSWVSRATQTTSRASCHTSAMSDSGFSLPGKHARPSHAFSLWQVLRPCLLGGLWGAVWASCRALG